MSRGVLIIRAEQEQSALELKLRERGLDAYCHSMVDINALPPSDEVKKLWQETHWDGIIAVSPNATRFFNRIVNEATWPKARKHYFAVGPGTGEPLLNFSKFPVTWPTTAHNSTALLELPELQSVDQEQWLIINGAPGRSIIPDTLTERGAKVTIASVYERVPKTGERAHIPAEWFEQIDRILVSSREQAELLVAHLQQAQKTDWGKACHWVVPSERIADAIRPLGVSEEHIHFAASAMADDLVAATVPIKTILPTPVSDTDMPETDKPNTKEKAEKITSKPAKAAQKPSGGSRFFTGFFLVILLLSVVTLGGGGWYLWQQQHTIQQHTNQEFEQLRTRLSEAQRTDAEFEARLTARLQQDTNAQLNRQKQEQQQALQSLREQQEVQQTRLRQQVAQQEQDLLRLSQRVRAAENRNTNGLLLSEAYDRVTVAVQRLSIGGSDTSVALNLLRSAKEILESDRASYQTIILQLERDIEMIKAVPVVDYTGVMLLLQELQKQVSHLQVHKGKLDADVPDEPVEVTSDVGNWRENIASAWQALSADLVRIERHAELPLRINQEQRLALVSRIELQLQLAQNALNRQQQEVYATTLDDVYTLVNDYFLPEESSTRQFLSALRSIKDLEITTDYPVSLISRAMLRERLHDLESAMPTAPEGAND